MRLRYRTADDIGVGLLIAISAMTAVIGMSFFAERNRVSASQPAGTVRQTQSTKPTPESNRCPGDLYLGHHNYEGYETAELICLDFARGEGTKLDPPGMVRLRDVHLSQEGHVQFLVEKLSIGIRESFDGKRTDSVIEGKFTVVNTPANQTTEYQMKLFNIHRVTGDRSARYSNAYYNREAGDMVGAEVMLFPDGDSTKGVMYFFMGYWGEPTLSPLWIEDFKRTGEGNYSFSLVLDHKSTEYRAKMSLNRLAISPAQTTLEWEEKEVTLKKQSELFPKLK